MEETLTREEVKRVIEVRGCARRVPIMFQKWCDPGYPHRQSGSFVR